MQGMRTTEQWKLPEKLTDPFEWAIADSSRGRWKGSEVFARRVYDAIVTHPLRAVVETLWRLDRVRANALVDNVGAALCALDVKNQRSWVQREPRSITRKKAEQRAVRRIIGDL